MVGRLQPWLLPDEDAIALEITAASGLTSRLTQRIARRFTFDGVEHELVQDDEGEWSEWLIFTNAKRRPWTSLRRYRPW